MPCLCAGIHTFHSCICADIYTVIHADRLLNIHMHTYIHTHATTFQRTSSQVRRQWREDPDIRTPHTHTRVYIHTYVECVHAYPDKVGGGAVAKFNHPNKLTVTMTVTVTVTVTVICTYVLWLTCLLNVFSGGAKNSADMHK
jgi:hypothetical protein